MGKPPHNFDGNADGNRILPQHAVSRQTPLECVVLHRIPPYHALRIGLRTEKVAGSSPAERAKKTTAFAGVFSCCSSSSLTAISATWKAIFEWVPSQNGFVVATPQRHRAIVSCSERNSLPSASTTIGSLTRHDPSRVAIFACSAIVIYVSMT